MKLGKRNLFYSLLLASVMLLFLVGYFVYMLPSLYVDYTMEQNLRAVKEQHRAYAKHGSYANVRVKNPTACFSVRIPESGDSVFFSSKMFSAELVISDERLYELFAEVRSLMMDYEQTGMPDREDFAEQFENRTDEWLETLDDVFGGQKALPFEVNILQKQNAGEEWHGEYEKVHIVSDSCVVVELGIEDANNRYVNYIAVERTEESILFTLLPVLTPEMNEIRPIVLQSLPMLTAVIVLLVLLFSQIYSRGIVTPIVRLVRHTERMKSSPRFLSSGEGRAASARGVRRTDEIGTLAATIDELYEKIRESYAQLETKNQALAKENERQEVLLRALSHQLKTPIAAALLLVDGMYNKIGKYQDTQKYLPKVKGELLSMRKMVEDILYLNRCGANPDLQELRLRPVLERQLELCRVAISEKSLTVDVDSAGDIILRTDEVIFSHILENLLSNAVNYTPEGGRIAIALDQNKLTIQNYGAQIDEEILPHVFEPFVSGTHGRTKGGAGHGLGLYIAAYYAGVIGVEIRLENAEHSVAASLRF